MAASLPLAQLSLSATISLISNTIPLSASLGGIFYRRKFQTNSSDSIPIRLQRFASKKGNPNILCPHFSVVPLWFIISRHIPISHIAAEHNSLDSIAYLAARIFAHIAICNTLQYLPLFKPLDELSHKSSPSHRLSLKSWLKRNKNAQLENGYLCFGYLITNFIANFIAVNL